MTINDIERQEAFKRFESIPKSTKRYNPSEKIKRQVEARDRISLIKEARELVCKVEDLL